VPYSVTKNTIGVSVWVDPDTGVAFALREL
jgi:hypothetical protein